MITLEQKLRKHIVTVHNFPKKGIAFKDLQSILSNPKLSKEVGDALIKIVSKEKPKAIVGLESRGFMFGMILARELNIPFIMVRKPGKLPPPIVSIEYMKEYGPDILEIREGLINKGDRIHIHDDLLATGGTATAAVKLLEKLGGKVVGCSFIMELIDLKGSNLFNKKISLTSLVTF